MSSSTPANATTTQTTTQTTPAATTTQTATIKKYQGANPEYQGNQLDFRNNDSVAAVKDAVTTIGRDPSYFTLGPGGFVQWDACALQSAPSFFKYLSSFTIHDLADE